MRLFAVLHFEQAFLEGDPVKDREHNGFRRYNSAASTQNGQASCARFATSAIDDADHQQSIIWLATASLPPETQKRQQSQ
jgi:hypothetical protein